MNNNCLVPDLVQAFLNVDNGMLVKATVVNAVQKS